MQIDFLLITFVLIVVAMIAFILVQKGAGATAGSAFGSGASNTVFGSKGSGNFLTKTTMILAFLFFAISMLMAMNASKQFTTATTGEVDLGVIGKLDTSTSDVPEISPTPGDASKQENSDIPAIDVKADGETIKVESDKLQDLIKKATDTTSEAGENGAQAVDALKAKAEETATDLKDKVIKKTEEVLKPTDG